MYRCLLAATAALACALPAAAQVARQFPQNALRGTLQFGTPPVLKVNGVDAQVAPAVKVRGLQNTIEMTAALVGIKAVANYTVDINGQVKDVWILRPEEIAVKPWPTTLQQAQTWSFDPIAQVWTKP